MNGEWQEDGYVNIAFGGVELLWTGSTLGYRILVEIGGWGTAWDERRRLSPILFGLRLLAPVFC